MFGRERDGKSKSQSGSLIYVGVILLLGMMSSGISGSLLALIIGVIAAGALGYLIAYLVKKYMKNKNVSDGGQRRSYTSHQNHTPRAYNPGEIREIDNFRRMQQLNSFLENGLIDKKEYNVLKEKYERYANSQ